jgi:hypothetical protein
VYDTVLPDLVRREVPPPDEPYDEDRPPPPLLYEEPDGYDDREYDPPQLLHAGQFAAALAVR